MKTVEQITDYLNERSMSPKDICLIYNYMEVIGHRIKGYREFKDMKIKRGSFEDFKRWVNKEGADETDC